MSVKVYAGNVWTYYIDNLTSSTLCLPHGSPELYGANLWGDTVGSDTPTYFFANNHKTVSLETHPATKSGDYVPIDNWFYNVAINPQASTGYCKNLDTSSYCMITFDASDPNNFKTEAHSGGTSTLRSYSARWVERSSFQR